MRLPSAHSLLEANVGVAKCNSNLLRCTHRAALGGAILLLCMDEGALEPFLRATTALYTRSKWCLPLHFPPCVPSVAALPPHS